MALDNVFVNYTSGVDDPGNGSIGSPVKTINYGIALTNPNGNTYLRGGTHVTTTYIGNNMPNGTNDASRYTLQNYDDEDVVIQRSGGDSTALMYISLGGGTARSYITITGSSGHPIIMDGNSKQAQGGIYFLTPGSGAHTGINLDYLEIRNVDDSGVNTGTSTGLRFRNLEIHDVGTATNLDHCLYVNGTTNSLFEDCEFYNAIAAGAQTQSSGVAASNNIFRRINTHNNGSQGFIINSGVGNRIEYCLIWLNGSVGLYFRGGSGHFAYNNVIYKNTQASSAANTQNDADTPNCTLKNNISIGGPNSQWSINGPGAVTSNNIITGTAANFWTDPDNGDFTLKNTAGTPHADVTSAIIDQGASVGLGTDYYGTSVPQGVAVDIGATEWGADPPDAPIATHDPAYTVSTVYGDVTVTLVKGTNNIVECTLSGTGAAALCVDNADVTVVRN